MSLLALQDLFRRYREKATGVWKLGQDPYRTIYIDYGDAVFAQSSHLQDRLTYLLVERGKVSQAQMDYALANLKPGLSIGKNLIEMGFITQRDLLEVAKAQVERIVQGALSAPGEAPVFEARELDANVVRLPMNTPQLFLAGTLSLQDREGLLELLGPLNQVVVLQGRNLMDLNLPPDLAKLPPLLDGTHTLLELSRESMAEPLRLGAFALFLREMGWARLHEMPPLDRQALDLDFAPEEPLSPPLAEGIPDTVPTLFATIQEAERPTTNLEHLSQAFDHDLAPAGTAEPEPGAEPLHMPESLELPHPDGEPLGLTEPLGFSEVPEPVQTADGAWPQAPLRVEPDPDREQPPMMAIPPMREHLEEPTVPLRIPREPEEPAEAAAEAPAKPAKGKGLRRTLMGLVLLACLGGGASLWMARTSKAKPLPGDPGSEPKPAAAPVAPAPVPAPPPVQPSPAPPVPAPVAAPAPAAKAAPVPPVPAPKAAPAAPAPAAKAAPVATTIAARLAALEKGDLELAVKQGKRVLQEAPPSHWTLRLEIACQGDTIRRVAEVFGGKQPDLFLLPMAMRDGRVCYQVFYGRFPSESAARLESKHLPATFRETQNLPKLLRLSEVAKHQ